MATAFWGLQILPNKTYSQVIEGSFRVSMASFGEEVKGKQRSCLKVVVDEQTYILCSLTPNKVEQQPLDIIFTEGEEITFSVNGENAIHLTGNYLPDDEELDFDEEDFDSEEEDDINAMMEESEEESEEEEEEEIPVPAKKRKQPNGVAKEEAPKKKSKEEKVEVKQTKKTEAPKPKAEAKKAEAAKPKVEEKKAEKKKQEKPVKDEPSTRTLPGGLVIEDKTVGSGVAAKRGNRIGMRYIGRLTNGKIFDQNTSGKPFWFRLGAGEVISGWDKGIAGMKAGGERKLTIPAALAYGSRGAPPDIPGNATLVFEVKLVQIK
ncbi:peptidylprolyl isomerase fpr3 [Basidiobolus ranarum]|uniref:peptidylprolyl isomerase n=1 Tax=Basidiobolus ranarum TaxID=34480 RepID=A0ABR2WYF6_9FUNG